jgi:uncharacterized FlaG/YvyC family protein
MDQVSATALRDGAIPDLQNVTVTKDQRAQTRALLAAVHVLNQSGAAGDGKEVTYSMDSVIRKPVIRVVDQQSREVPVQWPSEYVLQMAEEYRKENPEK